MREIRPATAHRMLEPIGTWEQVDDGVTVHLTNGFARNVSMSSDGTRVAVIYRDGFGTPANGYIVAKGVVIVYEYNANAAAGIAVAAARRQR